MAENSKEGDSDVDLYYDLEEIEKDCKTNEEFSDTTGASIPNISTLLSENECNIVFSEDGKKTRIEIKKQVDGKEDSANSQSLVKDLDLFTDVVTEKFVQAEQEKLERQSLILQNIELKKLNSRLETEINVLMKKNRTLTKNICALYKTAKEEMSRKDALIADLREKNDGMIFRRTRLLGAGTGPARQSAKFQGRGVAMAAGVQQLNGTNSELKAKSHGVAITNSFADDQAVVVEYNTGSCRNLGQRPDASLQSGSAHKHNLERRKKLPKAFQDPEKHSHRRHLSHKSNRKRKRCKTELEGTCSGSEHSVDSNGSNSSESDAGHLFHETLREIKKSSSFKKQHKRSILSDAELRCIYSDYQRSLDGPKSSGENREKENPNSSGSKSGNFNKGNMNCDSEEAIAARNNLFKKLMSYERQDFLREMDRQKKDTELKRIISNTSNVEDFTQLYSKYLARWSLASIKTSSDLNREDDSDDPGEGDCEEDCEEDYDEYYESDYEYHSAPKYVDLDKPNDHFYGTPQKSFYDVLMEEKARQVHMYCGKDYQTISSVNSSKLAKNKQCVVEEVLSASQLPEALKHDSLKLFGYRGKPVPIAVKKKVLGYAKSPTKAATEKNKVSSNVSTSELKKSQYSKQPS